MISFEIAEQSPHTCVVRLAGDIDTAVVPELQGQLGSAFARGCENVVLDLSAVDYADSSALGLLVWLDRRLGPEGGRVMLAGANADVERILELSGLITFARSIGAASDVSSAIAGLQLAGEPDELLWSSHLEMPAGVDDLARMRTAVCDLIAPLGFSESTLFDVKVALGEALANAVRHGTTQESGPLIGVDVLAYRDRVVVEVKDRGRGFDGTPAPSEDLYAPSGRGVTFMRALMDRVEFETPPAGGTIVRLVKHRNGHSA